MEAFRKNVMLIAVGLIVGGLAIEYGPAAMRLLPFMSQPVDAIIVYESKMDAVPTREFTRMITHAPIDCGVKVIDKDTLGKGRQPSPELIPYLEAAKDHELPVLVTRWAGGSYSVVPCPETLEELKAEVGL